MTRLRKGQPKDPVELRVANLQFLREQDGAPERLLKRRLIKVFAEYPGVRKAYLAQVSVADELGVVLCLRTLQGPDQNLVRKMGEVFAALFDTREHLDNLFLEDAEELSLANVCQAR